MHEHQRRRRDAGLADVGSWTRRAVFAGVALSAVLAAAGARLVPGQDASSASTTPSSHPAPTSSPSHSPSDDGGTDNGTDGDTDNGGGGGLTPPTQAPQPTHHRSHHVTSGGS